MNIKEADLSHLASPTASIGLDTSGSNSENPLNSQDAVRLAYSADRIKLFGVVRSGFGRLSELASNLGAEIKAKKLEVAGGLLLIASAAACGGGSDVNASAKGAKETQPPAAAVNLTSEPATASATPKVEIIKTPEPTKVATVVPEQKVECPPMPQPVKAYYDDLIRLNSSGVLKDATTGGPIAENLMRKHFLDPIEQAVCFTDPNKSREEFIRFNGLIGSLQILGSQYYATRNSQIVDVAQKYVAYLERDYPALLNNSKNAVIPEFLPQHLK